MTDAELDKLIRPVLERVFQAAKGGADDMGCALAFNAAAKHLPADVRLDLVMQLPRICQGAREAAKKPNAAGFTQADLARFAEYFAVSADGTYPADMHREMGCTPRQFAEATGCRMRLGTDGKLSGWVPGERSAQLSAVGAATGNVGAIPAKQHSAEQPADGVIDDDDADDDHFTPGEASADVQPEPSAEQLDMLREMILSCHAEGDTDTAGWLASIAHDGPMLAKVTGIDGTADATEDVFGADADGREHKGKGPGGGQFAPKGGGGASGGGKKSKREKRKAKQEKRERAALSAAVTTADPTLADKPKLVARVADAALTGIAKAKAFLIKHQDKLDTLATVLGIALDTPADMAKLGYNPSASSGTQAANPAFDPARAAGLPVSGHVLATVASHALSRLFVWAKGKIAGKPTTMAAGADVADVADVLAELLTILADELGLAAPDVDAIRAALAKNSASTFADWEEGKHPRGQPGNAGQFGPGGGGTKKDTTSATRSTDSGPKHDPGATPASTNPANRGQKTGSASSGSKEARRADAGKHVRAASKFKDVARRRRVIHAIKNEVELAKAIGGASLPDSEPADVLLIRDPEGKSVTDHAAAMQVLKDREQGIRWQKNPPPELIDPESKSEYLAKLDPGTRAQLIAHYREDVVQRERVARAMQSTVHLIEVKTLLTSPKGEVHMNKYALRRKQRWEQRYGALFHTVALDDRRGGKHSGNRVHYTPEVGKTLKLANMHKAGSLADVFKLITEGA